MFDLDKIFYLSKKFALPDTLLKLKNYCAALTAQSATKQKSARFIWVFIVLGIYNFDTSTGRGWILHMTSCNLFTLIFPRNSRHNVKKNGIYAFEVWRWRFWQESVKKSNNYCKVVKSCASASTWWKFSFSTNTFYAIAIQCGSQHNQTFSSW